MNLADSLDGRTNALRFPDVAETLSICERQVYKTRCRQSHTGFQGRRLAPFRSGCLRRMAVAKDRALLGAPCRQRAEAFLSALTFWAAASLRFSAYSRISDSPSVGQGKVETGKHERYSTRNKGQSMLGGPGPDTSCFPQNPVALQKPGVKLAGLHPLNHISKSASNAR